MIRSWLLNGKRLPTRYPTYLVLYRLHARAVKLGGRGAVGQDSNLDPTWRCQDWNLDPRGERVVAYAGTAPFTEERHAGGPALVQRPGPGRGRQPGRREG